MLYTGIGAFILWLVLAFVVAAGARNRGRSYGGFLALSIFFSPLVAALILLILGKKETPVSLTDDNKGVVNSAIVNNGKFSVEKLPVVAGVIYTFLTALIFGVAGASLVIFLARTL